MISPGHTWALIRFLAPPVLRAASFSRWRRWRFAVRFSGLAKGSAGRRAAGRWLSWLTAVRSLVEAMGSSAVAMACRAATSRARWSTTGRQTERSESFENL